MESRVKNGAREESAEVMTRLRVWFFAVSWKIYMLDEIKR